MSSRFTQFILGAMVLGIIMGAAIFNLMPDHRVEIAADLFNLTNNTNFAIPGGNQNVPTTFLVLTAYNTSYSPRKLQIGARIVF